MKHNDYSLRQVNDHRIEIRAVCTLPCSYDTILSMQHLIEIRMGGDFDAVSFRVAAAELSDD